MRTPPKSDKTGMRTLRKSELLRVATLNLNNSSDYCEERVNAVVQEALTAKVEVLLLQEFTAETKHLITPLLVKNGYQHHIISDSVVSKQTHLKGSSTAIFSRLPFKESRELNLTALQGAYKAATAVINKNGYEVLLISTHLAWGAENGSLRLRQALIIDEYSARVISRLQSPVAAVGGTFNDIPDGDSVRYLRGRKASEATHSTFWLDVTEGTPLYNTPTTRHDTILGRNAAESTGVLDVNLVPERRIDYLFVKGWAYGREGHPFNTKLFGTSELDNGYTVSDHYGIMTDIWLPTKN